MSYRANYQITFVILLRKNCMAKDVEIAANDLMVYFRGLKVALGKGNVDDAIRYIHKIKTELDDNLEYLQSKKSTQQNSQGSPASSQAA